MAYLHKKFHAAFAVVVAGLLACGGCGQQKVSDHLSATPPSAKQTSTAQPTAGLLDLYNTSIPTDEPLPGILGLLALQDKADLHAIQASITNQTYTHAYYFPSAYGDQHMGVLSTRPATSRFHHTNLTHTSEGQTLPLARPFAELHFAASTNQPALTIVLAHLKSTAFHPANQYEIRRNETRLLTRLMEKLLSDSSTNTPPDLVLMGLLQDDPDSANIATLQKTGLIDLRPTDPAGTVWTTVQKNDLYRRAHYLMASPTLAKRLSTEDYWITATSDKEKQHGRVLLLHQTKK